MKKPATTALLIIDLQKTFDPKLEMIKEILKISKNYKTILATQFIFGNPLYQKVLGKLKDSNKDFSLFPLPKNTLVFQKTGYGLPASLVSYLSKKKIKRVDICGVQTESCVLASAFNLWDMGIEPRVLKNLVSTKKKNMRYHRAAFLVFKKNFEKK